jgi:uncharacterized membrane protein YvlD (DUF360 family)
MVIMWILIRSLLHIVAYSLSLYFLDYYGLLRWVQFDFSVSTWQEIVIVYLLIWLIFWIWFAIIKKILNILAFPLHLITLWFIWFVINIVIFYLCQLFINTYLTGIEMQITSFTWLVLVSFILSIIVSIIYWILKKII